MESLWIFQTVGWIHFKFFFFFTLSSSLWRYPNADKTFYKLSDYSWGKLEGKMEKQSRAAALKRNTASLWAALCSRRDDYLMPQGTTRSSAHYKDQIRLCFFKKGGFFQTLLGNWTLPSGWISLVLLADVTVFRRPERTADGSLCN